MSPVETDVEFRSRIKADLMSISFAHWYLSLASGKELDDLAKTIGLVRESDIEIQAQGLIRTEEIVEVKRFKYQ